MLHLLLSERLVESRSVSGLLLCSARSMAILMSSTHRSISDAQLDRGEELRDKDKEEQKHVLCSQIFVNSEQTEPLNGN